MDTQALTGHMLALHIASKVLQEAPDPVFLSQAHERSLFSEWPVKPSSPEALSSLSALKGLFMAGPGDADALHREHLALFSGPNPAARPWESVWREKDKLLFGENTALVRDTYAAWGIATERQGHEPEDHIGLELAFCVTLLQRALEDGDVSALGALATFLDDHLLQWAGPCLRAASEAASEPFYRHMPTLCLDALEGLRAKLPSERQPE